MGRLIDATAIRRQLVSRQTTLYFFNNEVRHEIGCIVEMVDNAPTIDAVPVVRCEVCKHWCGSIGIVDRPNGHCFCHNIKTNGHDFCSCGERRSTSENELYSKLR